MIIWLVKLVVWCSFHSFDSTFLGSAMKMDQLRSFSVSPLLYFSFTISIILSMPKLFKTARISHLVLLLCSCSYFRFFPYFCVLQVSLSLWKSSPIYLSLWCLFFLIIIMNVLSYSVAELIFSLCHSYFSCLHLFLTTLFNTL